MTRFSQALDNLEVLELDGRSLEISDVVSVARHRRRVRLAPAALPAIRRCRMMIDALVERDQKVYGLTTGFGKLRDVIIEREDAEKLQTNLIRSHAAGVGKPFPEDVVRASILLRANTLCRGNSGMRAKVIQAFLDMLNDDIYPHMPEQGSVGASGDLAPLSHLALLLMGDAGARFHKRETSSGTPELILEPRDADFINYPADGSVDAVAQKHGWNNFRPVHLQAKEGLAANNGTQVMCAIACLGLYDADRLLETAEMTASMSLEANYGVLGAFDERIHRVRPLAYQATSAAKVTNYVSGSEIVGMYLNSAHLFRGKRYLEEAQEYLARIREEVDGEDSSAHQEFAETSEKLCALFSQVEKLIPQNEQGQFDNSSLQEALGQPPRKQIRWFEDYISDARRSAAALLQYIQQPNYPVATDSGKLASAIVSAVQQLDDAVPSAPIVQDDYSYRCFPQVVACAHRSLSHVQDIVETEINSATDNPLLFPPEAPEPDMSEEAYGEWLLKEGFAQCAENVIGGGNFHGQPISVAMDYLAMAMAEVGSISERRVAHLVDEHASRGLPGFLIESTGINSGFMIAQYTAASLVSENKTLCHPASIDSIPTCANSEDHVSMGTIAARKTAKIIENVRRIVGIELLAAYQGLHFRKPLLPGKTLRKAIIIMEEHGVKPLLEDAVLGPLLTHMEHLIAGSAFSSAFVSLPKADS